MEKRVIPLICGLILLIGVTFINITIKADEDSELLALNVDYVETTTTEETTTEETTTTITTSKTTKKETQPSRTTSSNTTTTTTSKPTTTTTSISDNSNINVFYNNIITNTYNNLLPLPIKNKLDNNGVKLIVTNDSKAVEKNYGYKSAIAVADYYNKYIVIEAADNQFSINSLYKWGVDRNTISKYNNTSATTIILENNVLHEAAHMLDYLTNFNYSRYIGEIRERESDSYINTEAFKIAANNSRQNIKTNEEYFASLFSSYITFNDEIKEKTPESYQYIKNVLASYGA